MAVNNHYLYIMLLAKLASVVIIEVQWFEK